MAPVRQLHWSQAKAGVVSRVGLMWKLQMSFLTFLHYQSMKKLTYFSVCLSICPAGPGLPLQFTALKFRYYILLCNYLNMLFLIQQKQF